MDFLQKVQEGIRGQNMLEEGDGVLVGLSGGADSCALLLALHALRGEYGLTLYACHVNHLLRGEEAMADEALSRELCKKLGVPCAVLRRDVAAMSREQGISLEECGREVRYEAFSLVAQAALKMDQSLFGETLPPPPPKIKIATAHTLDDSAETLLFNLARGTGLKGVCGIPPVRGDIVRPLYRCTREETERFCGENEVVWAWDSTNSQLVYARNALRHQVLKPLKNLYPSFLEQIARFQDTARLEEDYLAAQAGKAFRECARGETLGLAYFEKLHPAVQRRVLLLWLEEMGARRDAGTVARLMKLAARGKGQEQGDGGRVFLLRGGTLSCLEPCPVPFYSFPLKEGENPLPWGDRLLFSTVSQKCGENFGKNFPKGFFFYLDCGKIKGTIVARQRLPGDRFAPAGRGVTKTLKKLFNEAKIIPYNREKIPVLADDAGVIAVVGFGADERVRVDHSTKRAARICFLPCFGEE